MEDYDKEALREAKLCAAVETEMLADISRSMFLIEDRTSDFSPFENYDKYYYVRDIILKGVPKIIGIAQACCLRDIRGRNQEEIITSVLVSDAINSDPELGGLFKPDELYESVYTYINSSWCTLKEDEE